MQESECKDCPFTVCQYTSEICGSLPTFAKALVVTEEKSDDDASFTICKTVPDRQLIFGWANVCKTKEGTIPIDWEGDIMSAEDLEPAAYSHVLKYRETGERHQGEAKGILVESLMVTKEKMAAMGIPEGTLPEGWWVGYYIPDATVFAKCRDGVYGMFSIQGGGVRKQIKGGTE